MDAAREGVEVGSSILFSKIESAYSRFPDFVTEIQAILRQGQMPVEAPGAVPALADAMARPGHLRDDLLSMVNVLCYQEPGTSTLDLLGLLLVAAAGQAGADAAEDTPGLEQPVRRIFNVLVDAKRNRLAEDEARDLETAAEPPSVEPTDFVKDLTPEQLTPLPFQGPPTAVAAYAEPRGSVLARALAISADEHGATEHAAASPAKPDADPRPLPASSPVSTANDPAPAPIRSAPPLAVPFAAELQEQVPSRRFPGWAIGLCGVLLGLLLGLLLQRRLSTPTAVPTTDTTTPATEAVGAGVTPGTRAHANATERVRVSPPERTPAGAEEARRSPEARVGTAERGSRNPVAGTGKASSADPASSRPALGTAAAVPPVPARAATPRVVAPPPVRPVDLGTPPSLDSVGSVRSGPRPPSVVTGASGIMAANLIASPAPAYPFAANAARVQGEVVIQAVVDRDGNVTEARVVSGPLLLRDAALDAVQRWRFRPYEVDGKAAEIATTARVEFRLNH